MALSLPPWRSSRRRYVSRSFRGWWTTASSFARLGARPPARKGHRADAGPVQVDRAVIGLTASGSTLQRNGPEHRAGVARPLYRVGPGRGIADRTDLCRHRAGPAPDRADPSA